MRENPGARVIPWHRINKERIPSRSSNLAVHQALHGRAGLVFLSPLTLLLGLPITK